MFLWIAFLMSAPVVAGDFEFTDCTTCHARVVAGAQKHEAAVFDCERCHLAGHSAKTTKYYLKGNITALCNQCHKISDGGHMTGGHPAEGPQDPVHPEKEFTCVSCHNPHSGSKQGFFRYRFGQGTNFQIVCAICHWDIAGNGGPKPPAPPWNDDEPQPTSGGEARP